MKKVVIISQDEYNSIKILLEDALSNLDAVVSSFYVEEVNRRLNSALKILKNEEK
jgi:hypothetical protein